MKDKVVLITGASKRVGACIATRLHQAGARVIIHYGSSKTKAETLINQFNAIRPDSAVALQANLNDITEVEELAQATLKVWNQIDVLINNASSFYPTKVGDVSSEVWNDLFGSNVKAPFFLAQALTPELIKRQGNIINMVDIHADRPLKDFSIYCMAKAALVAMTKALARDLAPNVRVNGIAPGMILWPDNEPLDPKTENYLLNRIVLKRFGNPENIAETVLFLLKNNYMTGQIIPVDGGRNLMI